MVSPNGYTIDTGETYTYDYVNACSWYEITAGSQKVSRFRMRFKDMQFKDQSSGQDYYLRTVEMALTDADEIKVVASRSSPGTQAENIFIFKNVNIGSFQDFYVKDQDAVILDSFMRLWLNALTADTNAVITEPADVLTLDNMYVFSDDVTKLNPTNIAFRFQGLWFEDKDGNPSNADYSKTVVNTGDSWPT